MDTDDPGGIVSRQAGEEREAESYLPRKLVKGSSSAGSQLSKGWFPHTHTIEYEPEVLISLTRLVGMGLVLERYRRSFPQSVSPDPAPLTELPKRCYFLSPFGDRFLTFIEETPSTRSS